MIRSPTPRLETRKSPAESRVPNPLPIGEGRPAIAYAERPPAEAVSSAISARTVGVETAGSRCIVGGVRGLHRGRHGDGLLVALSGHRRTGVVLFGHEA